MLTSSLGEAVGNAGSSPDGVHLDPFLLVVAGIRQIIFARMKAYEIA